MKTQLLCTFTNKKYLDDIIEKIKESYKVVFNKIYVLQNEDNVSELICTYNVETNEELDYNLVLNTISLHRKQHSNTLYTINALGEASVAYKLDKKTGAVTALYNLMEFPVEKFSESGPSAQWSWPQRSEANHLLDYGD